LYINNTTFGNYAMKIGFPNCWFQGTSTLSVNSVHFVLSLYSCQMPHVSVTFCYVALKYLSPANAIYSAVCPQHSKHMSQI
jgi:hypothetical protein